MLRRAVIFAVIANIVLFASLAFTGNISGDPSTIVFIDFWGRFVVYSLWIVAYVIYRRLFDDKPVVQTLIILLVVLNIPLFLGLSYADKIQVTPENLAVIDFWGRLTVYSLWFMLYELYRKHLAAPDDPQPLG
ncbi:MAG TPA: hypothetical protein VK614_01635 [Allosphingosinicella sp.]|nr:hypothetical protein [Allosphingosinicella sp.]